MVYEKEDESMNVVRTLRKIVSRIDIELSSKIMYRAFLHKRLNLDSPSTFNEKLCWLKLKVFPTDSLVIRCTDKYLVRDYLQAKGFADILVKIIGVWDRAEDIDWNLLPDKFVLKCNHGCAYNVVCKDKKSLDTRKTVKQLNGFLKEDFGLVSGEPHYSKIQRKIICEEYLEGELFDYKFFCFNGEPKFYYAAVTPSGDFHYMRCDFFWPDGTLTDFYRIDHKRLGVPPEKPKNLDKMLDIARKLSEDFPFVRVDLMLVGENIHFSELTFTPSAGIMPLTPDGTDEKIGQWLDLSLYHCL